MKVPDYRELIKDMPSHRRGDADIPVQSCEHACADDKRAGYRGAAPAGYIQHRQRQEDARLRQYQSWQDGGVFVVRGAFPIDLFLVFLNEVVPGLSAEDLQYFRGSGVQVSYVLPVNQRQFFQTLSVFERRSSNMSVQRETAKILMQKIGTKEYPRHSLQG